MIENQIDMMEIIMEDKITKVDESTKYENLIGVKEDFPLRATLFAASNGATTSEHLDPEDNITEEKDWHKHWVGMPEFKQEDNPPYMKIYMSFRNKEDFDNFAELINQNLSEKTKSIWYPKLDRDQNSLKRWIEE